MSPAHAAAEAALQEKAAAKAAQPEALAAASREAASAAAVATLPLLAPPPYERLCWAAANGGDYGAVAWPEVAPKRHCSHDDDDDDGGDDGDDGGGGGGSDGGGDGGGGGGGAGPHQRLKAPDPLAVERLLVRLLRELVVPPDNRSRRRRPLAPPLAPTTSRLPGYTKPLSYKEKQRRLRRKFRERKAEAAAKAAAVVSAKAARPEQSEGIAGIFDGVYGEDDIDGGRSDSNDDGGGGGAGGGASGGGQRRKDREVAAWQGMAGASEASEAFG